MKLSKMILLLMSLFCYGFGLTALEIISFSFASDDNHRAPTFISSSGNQIYGKSEVYLFVDKNNDNNGGVIKYQAYFKFEGDLYDYKIIPYQNGYLHVWSVKGIYKFYHMDPVHSSPPILEVKFYNSVLTSWSASPNYIGETMTLQDYERVDPNMTFISYSILNGIGIPQTYLVRHETFAFTFTDIRATTGSVPIPVNSNGEFLTKWNSEGSFSASASDN